LKYFTPKETEVNRRDFIRVSCGAALAMALPGKEVLARAASYEGCTKSFQAVAVGGSGALYSSLPDAIEQEALSGDEVKILLLEDIYEAIVIPKFCSKKVSVDLGGHKLFTSEDGLVCKNEGTGDLSIYGGTFIHKK
jgi:hypothetical protein